MIKSLKQDVQAAMSLILFTCRMLWTIAKEK